MKQPHILLIVNSDFAVRHTIGARIFPIAQELKERGISYYIFCRDYPSDIQDNALIKTIPGGRWIMKCLSAIPMFIHPRLRTDRIKNKLFQLFLIRKLKKMDLSSVQVIHSWDFLSHVYTYIRSSYPHIRIIQDVPMGFHISLPPTVPNGATGIDTGMPQYMKDVIPYVTHFIAPSSFVQDSLTYEGIDKTNITVIPFGVDVELFYPTIKKESPLFKVAFVGAINKRKGIPYLLAAWKTLNIKNAELHLYGRVYTDMREMLRDAKDYHIYVHGFIDVVDVLSNHDIYVFPSLLEGSAKSVYEALACGLPVITTLNAGSVVTNGKDGFIIPVQNVELLKEKILFFYEHPEMVAIYGKQARAKAETYTWELYAKKVIHEYHKYFTS